MTSSSNYTVTAQGGGLVCSANWTSFLAFDIGPDSRVSGSASTDLVGTPVCTHPEYFTAPVTTMASGITGIVTAAQLQLQFNQLSYVPAGSFDATGMSASLYGINTSPPVITISLTAPGHAAGSQQLQTVTGSNSYTSDNTLELDCPSC